MRTSSTRNASGTRTAAAMAFAFAIALSLPAAAGAQGTARVDENAFRWAGSIPADKWIHLYNINGEISVEPAAGDRVEVRASKRWRRGNPGDVRIEAKTLSDGSVVVCAMWTETTTCDERGMRSSGRNRNGNNNNDTNVRFTVLVPRNVRVHASTVNGGLKIGGATGEVNASTVNGSIEAISSGGPVNASTVNGSIRVRMGALDPDEDLEYSTVNGSVIVEFPGDLNANVELSTVNGRLQTDYPVTIQGRMDPRRLRATIGRGGQDIKLSTVNGNVELRKAVRN
jgi:hypothetical protein